MRTRPLLRRLALVAGLTASLGLGSAGAGALPAGAASTAAGAKACDRLNSRVAQVPAIRARIDDQLQRIDDRLATVANPERRGRLAARIQPRVDALRALDERLARQVALVRERCPV